LDYENNVKTVFTNYAVESTTPHRRLLL